MERDLWGLLTRCTNGISTHTLTWSVTHHVELTDGGKYNFNSHAHVERDNMKWKRFWHDINFNSHAHVERDGFGGCFMDVHRISTHTLTWSVTTIIVHCTLPQRISTHTLTWSVT